MNRGFDLADFQANPRKYEMFRTARIATDQLMDFDHGECVSIAYLFSAQEDCIQGSIVPVYEVISSKGGQVAVHYMYANAFSDFCL